MSGDGEVDNTTGLDITTIVVIERVRLNQYGDAMIDFRGDEGPGTFTMPAELVTLSYLRDVRHWQSHGIHVSLARDDEGEIVLISDCINCLDRVGEALDAIQSIQGGVADLAHTAFSVVVSDTPRRLLNWWLATESPAPAGAEGAAVSTDT